MRSQKLTDYCLKLVKDKDYDSFLASLFIPKDKRPLVLALYAFNIESALISQGSSESSHLLKYKWWSDAIKGTFNSDAPSHPVTKIIEPYSSQLTQSFMLRILNSRLENLENPNFATIKDLEKYSENTYSALLYLLLESFGIRNTEADHVASHIGKAIGLTTVLRGIPASIQKRRLLLPIEEMAKTGASFEEIYRLQKLDSLETAVFQVASTAHSHLSHAQDLIAKQPVSEANLVYLRGFLAFDYLQQLQLANFNT